MEKNKAIELLKQALNEIPQLSELHHDNQDFVLWHDRVQNIIKATLDSDDLKRFASHRSAHIKGIFPDYVYQNDYIDRLTDYETALKSIIRKYEILGVGASESEVIEPHFSHRTLSYIIEMLANKRTDSELRNFFFKYDLLDVYEQSGKLTAKKRKVNDVFQHLLKSDENALQIIKSIVQETLKEEWFNRFPQKYPDLVRALNADGFQLHEGDLVPVTSPTVEPSKEEGLVETMLNKYGFNVAKTHLVQAYDNYLDGNWEASNGALRSFLQDVFDQIALKLWPEEATKKKAGGERRELLQEKGFIERDTEADLVKSFFKFAHGKGSHPGISNESDCRLRRYIAVALASYYLEKLGASLV